MTRRTRLSIEPLDARDLPSTMTVSAEPPPAGAPAQPANQAPVITGFRAIVGPSGQVTFVGTVTDDQAVAGYVVRITGNGVDASGIVQADGTFRITTTVTGTTDVTVMAQVTDGYGAKSSPVYTTFTPSA